MMNFCESPVKGYDSYLLKYCLKSNLFPLDILVQRNIYCGMCPWHSQYDNYSALGAASIICCFVYFIDFLLNDHYLP